MGTDINEKNFSLILYGGTHGEDLETVAFLDIQGDKHNVVPYAPDFQFVIKNNVSYDEALQKGVSFVSWHYSFIRPQISKIMDRQYNVIGYEIKPLYMPLRHGFSDILDVYYDIKGETVYMYVDFKPYIMNIFEHERDVDDR